MNTYKEKYEAIIAWLKKYEELNRNSIGVITGSAFFVKADDILSFLDTPPEQPVKSLPEWKWVKPDKQYPVGITREMDVNGDWQYCMSSGRLYESCQYLSLAELERKSIDAGPYPIEEQAASEELEEMIKYYREKTKELK